ncbi:cell cycle checkpoint protein, partial [Phenoliferia sp. Uapishka_3]
KKRGSDGKVKGASEEEIRKLLQFVTARESSLFIFHALGKVLYSKRWGISADDDKKDTGRQGVAPLKVLDRLPKHLRKEWSRAPSKVDPDVMFSEAPVDSDVFLSYIHHNYTAFTNEIEECLGIVENMSSADSLMRMEGEEWLRRAPLTSQYSFNVAVRSTLICLPSPVPHRKQTLRKSEMWEKMRETRANEEGIRELYRKRDGFAFLMGGEEGGVGGQRSRRGLMTEFVPAVGGMQRVRKSGSKFLIDLATFPPVKSSAFKATVEGQPLGEKEVDDLDEEEEDVDRQEGDDPDLMVVEEQVFVLEEEQLFDPDDDIEDD